MNVQDVLEQYKDAIHERDIESFLSIYDPAVHIYDCWGKWECIGLASWQENVTEWFIGLKAEEEILKVDFQDVVIEENANLAFAHCAVTYVAHKEASGEKLRQMTNRFTFCLEKVKDTWLITHEHSSLPISMEDGKGMFGLR
ncbi:YybH family protein [Rossellomorea vietnamensis]|uniref:YybH family protein n=1 Tax=Rossellomorea vietnamensis TaxID=218284 RepID=UPI001E4128A7|nr:nuclear transport factor 2 family protein [Rossellomorea vietnamensis]MCC5803616.1 nuclear transport factor 2 family protein [Rossellomorea vietnamensis]